MRALTCILILFFSTPASAKKSRGCQDFENTLQKEKIPILKAFHQLDLAQCLEGVSLQKARFSWQKAMHHKVLASYFKAAKAAVSFWITHDFYIDLRKWMYHSHELLANGKSYNRFDFPYARLNRKQREEWGQLFAQVLNYAYKKDSNDCLACDTHRILFEELVENPESKAVFKNPLFDKLREQMPFASHLKRMQKLESLHQSQDAIAFFESMLWPENKWSEQRCEISYLHAKSLRKIKKFPQSKASFLEVQQHCAEPWRMNSFFWRAKLELIAPSKQANAIFEGFVRKYPKHSFSDDVMYWQAIHALTSGYNREAHRILVRLVKTYPRGDMKNLALFRQTLLYAEEGSIAQAREFLKKIHSSKIGGFWEKEQALYWDARLQIYPNLHRFDPALAQSEREQAAHLLLLLVNQTPGTYYGLMARLLLNFAVAHKHLNPNFSPKHQGFSQLYSPMGATRKKEAFALAKIATLLQQNKRKKEAKNLLSQWIFLLDFDKNKPVDLADQFYELKRFDLSHQMMRRAGLAFFEGNIGHGRKWNLAYPIAYSTAIEEAAKHTKLNKALLTALAREEGLFDPYAYSWAGAAGLCQLMPQTAATEASALKIKLQGHNDLFKAQLNLKLGANHLSRNYKIFGHFALALMAYNGGPGNVSSWLSRFEKTQALDAFIEQVPFSETREYVKRVLSSWFVYHSLMNEKKEININIEFR